MTKPYEYLAIFYILRSIFLTRVAAERPPSPRGRAAVPRASYTAALGVPSERTGGNSQLGNRAASKGTLPGMGRLLPGKEGDPRQRRGLQHFRRSFPSGVAHTLTSTFKKSQTGFFQNSNQNRTAVKNERDSRSQTECKIKGPPTQITRFFEFHTKSKIKYSTLIPRLQIF